MLFRKINKIIILLTLKRNYTVEKGLQKFCRKYEVNAAPGVQQINVCNLGRLRTVRQVRVCDCPPKQPPSHYDKRNFRTLWLIIKLAIFSGIIYVTNDIGIWTTSDETERIYLRMNDTAESVFGQEDDLKNKLKIPDYKMIRRNIREIWNRAVVKAFSYFGLLAYSKTSNDEYPEPRKHLEETE